eukprot:2269760-Pleurochrysis_carterae.AAC.1
MTWHVLGTHRHARAGPCLALVCAAFADDYCGWHGALHAARSLNQGSLINSDASHVSSYILVLILVHIPRLHPKLLPTTLFARLEKARCAQHRRLLLQDHLLRFCSREPSCSHRNESQTMRSRSAVFRWSWCARAFLGVIHSASCRLLL